MIRAEAFDDQKGKGRNMTQRTTTILAALVVATMTLAAQAKDVSVASLPPSVTKTVPTCGNMKVPAATKQIKVTFSKQMKDKSWSFVQDSKDSFPEIIGKPKYLADGRTCVINVKLKPKKTYVIWLNSQKFQNFKDTSGKPAIPYLLTFQTQ